MQVSVRAAMHRLVKFPAWVYQRQQAFWDRAVLACGWMWLYLLCSGIEPWLRLSVQEGAGASVMLPAQWRVVMAALVLVLGLWRPVAGYAAFIVALAYPLYLISVYVMALALAVLVLLAPVMALYAEQGVLYLAVLVLMTVVLAPLHLAPLVPLLAGLWWQGAGSWVGGGAAALWLAATWIAVQLARRGSVRRDLTLDVAALGALVLLNAASCWPLVLGRGWMPEGGGDNAGFL